MKFSDQNIQNLIEYFQGKLLMGCNRPFMRYIRTSFRSFEKITWAYAQQSFLSNITILFIFTIGDSLILGFEKPESFGGKMCYYRYQLSIFNLKLTIPGFIIIKINCQR
jgi:preprotein translocase subunit SecE